MFGAPPSSLRFKVDEEGSKPVALAGLDTDDLGEIMRNDATYLLKLLRSEWRVEVRWP